MYINDIIYYACLVQLLLLYAQVILLWRINVIRNVPIVSMLLAAGQTDPMITTGKLMEFYMYALTSVYMYASVFYVCVFFLAKQPQTIL